MAPPEPSAQSATITITPPDPARLAEQVHEILSRPGTSDEQIELLLHKAVGLVNAAGAVFFVTHGDRAEALAQLLSKQAASWSDNLLEECGERALRSIKEGRATLAPLRSKPEASIICCPVPGEETATTGGCCLSTVAVLGEKGPEPYLIVLQILAATMALARSKLAPSSLLPMLATTAPSLDGTDLVETIKQWSRADIIALGLSQPNGKVRVAAISDVTTPDKRTKRNRLIEDVMRESLLRQIVLNWPDRDNQVDSQSSLLLKELVHDTAMQHGCALSLNAPGDDAVCLVLLWKAAAVKDTAIEELTSQSPVLAPLFYHVLRTFERRGSRRSTVAATRVRKLLGSGAALVFLGWFFFYPMPFHLHPDSQVKPVQIRYVVAAFDGIIEDVLVESGDQVDAGTELASLDGREIGLELSSIGAESSMALKMRDNHHVRGDVAAAQIAQLEYQRLQERAKLLTSRQDQLQISSPTNGIILSGDLKRNKQGPVRKGQVLFEIAPLDTVLIEMGIPDEDVGHVRVGQEVSVRFDAFPGRKWRGSIETVAPASQLIEGENLFTAAFEMDNEDRALQPGMRGNTRLFIDRRSPAWIYFHKPWYSLQRLVRSLF